MSTHDAVVLAVALIIWLACMVPIAVVTVKAYREGREPRPKVFCKDCKHHRKQPKHDLCYATKETKASYVTGEDRELFTPCLVENHRGECSLFEAKRDYPSPPKPTTPNPGTR